MDLSTLFTKFLALATLGGNLLLLGLLLFFFIRRSIFDRIMAWLGERATVIGFFISSVAMVGSLIYSEVSGFAACILCWIQRIFMYPQAFLFGLALWRKDRSIAPYAFLLSLIGAAVALYQWTKDMLSLYAPTNSLPCPAVSGLPSCDRIYVLEMGYITIPMIALNAFLLLLVVLWADMRRTAEHPQIAHPISRE